MTTSITGVLADVALVAGLVPDGATDRLAEQVGHPLCSGPGGEPPWFEHHDAAVAQPRLVEQPQRHDGGLAGTGRGDEHGLIVDRSRASPSAASVATTGRSATDVGIGTGVGLGRLLGISPRARASRGTDRDRRRPAGSGRDQAHEVAIASATRPPLGGVPALGRGLDGAVGAEEHERRQLGEAEALDERTVGVAVDEEVAR